MKKNVFYIAFIGFYSFNLFAIGHTDEPSFFLSTGLGLATYKSKMVESNDTSQTISYQLGIVGGSNDQLSMAYSRESTTTSFSYANTTATSKIIHSFEDTFLNYHFGFLSLGLVFSHLDMTVTNQDVAYLDLSAASQGYSMGLDFPVSKGTTVLVNVISTSGTSAKDIVQADTDQPKYGSRMDIFLGAKFDLTKSMLKMIMGYKQRTFALTVSGTSYLETHTMTFLGLDFNF